MANAFTGGASGAAWDNAVETAYNRDAKFALRNEPVWMPLVDTRAEKIAMPGDVHVFTIHQDMSTNTTPLVETVDPDAVALGAPTRVSVTFHEYGNSVIDTQYLQSLSFLNVESDKATIVGRNGVDSIDTLIKSVADGSTNTIGLNSAVIKTANTSLAVGSVASTDIYNNALASSVVTRLRADKVVPFAGQDYLVVAHPDVCHDLMAENSATSWNAPHTYGGDTSNVYNAEVGKFRGARYLSTTRVTTATDGASSAVVYRSYAFGKEALCEAMAVDLKLIIGPQVDKYRRFYPLSWYMLGGFALFRPTAMRKIYTSSSQAGL